MALAPEDIDADGCPSGNQAAEQNPDIVGYPEIRMALTSPVGAQVAEHDFDIVGHPRAAFRSLKRFLPMTSNSILTGRAGSGA